MRKIKKRQQPDRNRKLQQQEVGHGEKEEIITMVCFEKE